MVLEGIAPKVPVAPWAHDVFDMETWRRMARPGGRPSRRPTFPFGGYVHHPPPEPPSEGRAQKTGASGGAAMRSEEAVLGRSARAPVHRAGVLLFRACLINPTEHACLHWLVVRLYAPGGGERNYARRQTGPNSAAALGKRP